MKFLFRKDRVLIFLILATMGAGVLAIALSPGKMQTSKEYEATKAGVLGKVLKDDQGNPITSKDSVQEYLLFETGEYQIAYQKTYDLFLISINASPFNDVRGKAERQFLGLLEGNTKAACFFHVEIVTPFFANPELSGQRFPLSFCAL